MNVAKFVKKPKILSLRCPCGRPFEHPVGKRGRAPTYCPECRKHKTCKGKIDQEWVKFNKMTLGDGKAINDG